MNSFVERPSSAVSQKSGSTLDGSVDLLNTLRVLWRGRWIIALTAFVATLIGGYQVFARATPVYSASSVIMLETRQEQVVDLQSVVSGLSAETATINSEVEVLRSRRLIGQVVDELDLVNDPEFNSALRPPTLRAKVRQRIGDILSDSDAPVEREIDSETEKEIIRQNVISSLIRSISVRNIPVSLVFQITSRSNDPVKSASIADAIAEHYVNNQLAKKLEASEKATVWLTERVSSLQAELELAESRAREFSASTELVSSDALAAQERQLKEIRDRILSLQEAFAVGDERLSRLRSAEKYEEKVEVSGDAQLRRLLPELGSPGVVEDFESRFKIVLGRAEVEVSRLENQISALETSRDNIASAVDEQNEDLIRLQQLTREAEASRLLYQHFLTRLKETSAQQGVQQSDSSILSQAVVPTSPSEPRKSIALILSFLIGSIIGTAIVFWREVIQSSFRNPRDLEIATGYPVLGQVPLMRTKSGRRGVVEYLSQRPASAAAEAVRNLRTSLLLSNVDHPPKVFGVSSSIPGEGKTTVSFALAQNFATMGKRTLLVEGDLRRMVFDAYVGVNPKAESGLTSVLSGNEPLEEAVIHDPLTQTDILFGGSSSDNAADIFSSRRFGDFVSEARSKYDVIVIDTPPVLVVPDARIISGHVDAMVFTVRWDSTQRTQVSEALKMFESISHPVSGLVLNRINPKGMRRYGYGGRYGAYGAYGSYGSRYYTQ